MKLHFDVKETVGADLFALARELGGAALRRHVGEAARQLTQAHLRQLDSSRPNKLGGARTNFYAQAADATSFTVTDSGIDLVIAKVGFRQRYHGGSIRPSQSKWLTVPALPAAHGKRASDFVNLRFVPISSALALLKDKTQPKGRGRAMFVLKKRVNQAGDPTVLPTQTEYADAIARAVAEWVADMGGRN